MALDYAQREWTSTDRHGIAHPIKNPFEQARRGKYGILEKLSESPRWRKLGIGRPAIGYAAFFPDVGDGGRLSGPDAPARIIGARSDMDNLPAGVDSVFAYWSSEGPPATLPAPCARVALRAIFPRAPTPRPLPPP